MNNIKQSVESYLESEPKFRHRRNKDRGIANLLMERYGALGVAIQRGDIGKDTFIAIVQDYASMDRAWRKCLEERPDLRGDDYDDKDKLEERKMVELGYNTPRAIGPAEAVSDDKQPNLL